VAAIDSISARSAALKSGPAQYTRGIFRRLLRMEEIVKYPRSACRHATAGTVYDNHRRSKVNAECRSRIARHNWRAGKSLCYEPGRPLALPLSRNADACDD